VIKAITGYNETLCRVRWFAASGGRTDVRSEAAVFPTEEEARREIDALPYVLADPPTHYWIEPAE
jgi:hypothetical protein